MVPSARISVAGVCFVVSVELELPEMSTALFLIASVGSRFDCPSLSLGNSKNRATELESIVGYVAGALVSL